MKRELTAKQSNFIDNVVIGMTLSEAYRKAGYKCDVMTNESIAKQANRIAALPHISPIITQRKKELENEAIWTRKQSLTRLAAIANADITKFLTYKTVKTIVGRDPDTGEPVVDYKTVVDLLDSDEVDGSVIQEISISKDGTLKFKLYDKLRAIELANKMCGYNEPEKFDIDTTIVVTLSDELQEWAK